MTKKFHRARSADHAVEGEVAERGTKKVVDLGAVIEAFPPQIHFPTIHRPLRSGQAKLADVQEVTDLPSRLFLGDVDAKSFRRDKDGWSVRYHDADGHSVHLQVSQGRFVIQLRFLGAEITSIGPAEKPEALGRQLALGAARSFGEALQNDLEKKLPLKVINVDAGQPSACMVPDGWLWTFLVPVRVERLNNLLFLHNQLAETAQQTTPLEASVRLQSGTAEYATDFFEGQSDDADRAMKLLVRHLQLLGTPVLDEPTERPSDQGSPIWKLNRRAYVYRCTCFLRDVPRIAQRLSYAGFLSLEPDLQAAIMPTELLLSTSSVSWWSPQRECLNTWAGFTPQDLMTIEVAKSVRDDAQLAVRQAMKACEDYFTTVGLR